MSSRGHCWAACGLATALLSATLFVAAPSVHAATSATEWLVDTSHGGEPGTRAWAGRDRYDTSVRLARSFADFHGGLGSIPAVILASGESQADAVAAAGYAGALNAPILLTRSADLPSGVAEFIENYQIRHVVILGGTTAVSDAVAKQVASLSVRPTVNRLAGPDQYGTAAELARALGASARWCGGEESAVALVSGSALSDAIALGPMAFALGLPVLLTAQDRLPGASREFVLESDVERVVIVGGTGAVSAQVAADVRALGVAVTRVGSDNPAATSVEVATLMTGSCRELVQTDLSRVALLNSAAIADGLSAAAVLGVGAMMSPGMPLPTGPVPVLLVGDILPTEVSDYLAVTPRPEVSVRTVSVDAGVDVWLAAVGGTAVVPPAVMRAAVAAAAASPTANENHDCRPRGFNHGGYYLSSVTAGFPLPDWSASAVGPVRVAVLFVDFPDAPASHSTQLEVERTLAEIQDYFEGPSGGRLTLRFEVLHEWLRAPRDSGSLRGPEDTVDLARGKLDFSHIDTIMTVFPSDQFSLARFVGVVDVGGRSIPTFEMNISRLSEPRHVGTIGWAAAHELMHVFGLTDLYGGRRPEHKAGYRLARFTFGIMGLGGYHYISESDPLLHGKEPLDRTFWGVDYILSDDTDVLGWSRYQLGWLDPSQVHCVAEPDTVVVLGPLSRDGEDLRLAIVPVGPSQVIALEVEDTLYSPWGHGPPVFPSQAQGLLAYTVDAQDEFAQPIKLAGADDHRLIGRLPLMGVGEELTVWGHRITVLDETGGSYSVRIERLAESAHSSR